MDWLIPNTLQIIEEPSRASKDFIQWSNTWSRLLANDNFWLWLRLYSLWQVQEYNKAKVLKVLWWNHTLYWYSNGPLSIMCDVLKISDLPAGTFFRIPWSYGDIALNWFEWFAFQIESIEETFNLVNWNIKSGDIMTKYIVGCMQTSVLQNTKKGLPNINALFFPENIQQTPHTHPSQRIGIVKEWCWECVTSNDMIPLVKWNLFMILADPDFHEWITETNKFTKSWVHSFNTQSSSMTVIAWHWDSTTWPEDENSAMLNNTIIWGYGANHELNKNIRTQ